MLSMRLRLVSPRAESEEVPELPEPRLEREARCGALQRLGRRGQAVRTPDPRIPFGGSVKLLHQWQAGRRFIEALRGAVWTQKPKARDA